MYTINNKLENRKELKIQKVLAKELQYSEPFMAN